MSKVREITTGASAPLNPADILTVEELAARLKVSPVWVYNQMRPRLRKKRPLPVMKMGRLLRFHWPSVCDWLNNPRQGRAA